MPDVADHNFLDLSVESVSSIGLKRAQALQKVGVSTIGDLLYYFPRRYLDRSTVTKIIHLKVGQEATVVARVVRYGIKKGRRNRFILIVSDGSSYLSCIWFTRLSYWQRIFREGEWLALSGKVNYFGGYQMTHPDYDRLSGENEGEFIHTGKIIPVYPSTEALSKLGLDSRGFRRIISTLLKSHREKIQESLPETIVKRLNLMPLSEAIANIHFPENFGMLRRAQWR